MNHYFLLILGSMFFVFLSITAIPQRFYKEYKSFGSSEKKELFNSSSNYSILIIAIFGILGFLIEIIPEQKYNYSLLGLSFSLCFILFILVTNSKFHKIVKQQEENQKNHQNYLANQERNNVLAHEKHLKEIEERAYAEATGRARATWELQSKLYKEQIDGLIRLKQAGVNIEKQVLAMREEFMKMDSERKNAEIQNLINTLNNL